MIRRWGRRRNRTQRRDFCETCGTQPKRIWVVSAQFADASEAELGAGGGSWMTATYCKAHRPAEARRRPNPTR